MSADAPSARIWAGEPPDEEALAATDLLLTKLTGIPRQVRAFDVSEREAVGRLRISPALLARLEELSLADRRDGETYFDTCDLLNIQYSLGEGLLTVGLLRLWPKMLRALPKPGPVVFEIGFVASCPDPGHPGNCDFTMELPDGRSFRACTPGRRGDPLAWVRFERPTCWPELPPAARDVVDEMRGIRFALLPRMVKWDWNAFIRGTGLADCATFARLFARNGIRRGLSMRVSSGLLIAPPLALLHSCAEIEVDGVWVPTDPLMINTLVAHGRLDPEAWPAHRSTGATFYPLADAYQSVVTGTHRGEPVNVTFRSRIISGLLRVIQRLKRYARGVRTVAPNPAGVGSLGNYARRSVEVESRRAHRREVLRIIKFERKMADADVIDITPRSAFWVMPLQYLKEGGAAMCLIQRKQSRLKARPFTGQPDRDWIDIRWLLAFYDPETNPGVLGDRGVYIRHIQSHVVYPHDISQ